MLKKVLWLLLIACGIPQNTNAHNYPLCLESKQFIINSAIAGGIVGGGLGLIAAFEKQNHEKHAKHATTWEKIKSFPWHYVILPALVGAAGAGFIASFFTAEQYLASAEEELAALENNVLVDRALRTDDANELKKLAYNSKLPTLTTCERLELLLAKIKQAKEYLFTVIKSGTSGLASIAQAALERLNAMEQKIIDWISTLKQDSEYHKDLAIDLKNQIEQNTRRMAAAAESQARAAQSAAHAAWHSAHHIHNPHPVYVAPPPVNVYIRR